MGGHWSCSSRLENLGKVILGHILDFSVFSDGSTGGVDGVDGVDGVGLSIDLSVDAGMMRVSQR